MKKVTYSGSLNRKPIRTVVYIEDTLNIPFLIKHPLNGAILKRVGSVVSTDKEPEKGSLRIREYTSEELNSLSRREAEIVHNDIINNPDAYENPESLSKLSLEHWESEAKRIYAPLGKLEII